MVEGGGGWGGVESIRRLSGIILATNSKLLFVVRITGLWAHNVQSSMTLNIIYG